MHQRSDYWTLMASRCEYVYLLYIRILGRGYAGGTNRKGHLFHASGMKGEGLSELKYMSGLTIRHFVL